MILIIFKIYYGFMTEIGSATTGVLVAGNVRRQSPPRFGKLAHRIVMHINEHEGVHIVVMAISGVIGVCVLGLIPLMMVHLPLIALGAGILPAVFVFPVQFIIRKQANKYLKWEKQQSKERSQRQAAIPVAQQPVPPVAQPVPVVSLWRATPSKPRRRRLIEHEEP